MHRSTPRVPLSVRLCVAVVALSAMTVPAALAAPATTVQCGQVVTHDTKVANDLTGCTGSGLVIGSDDVTLDLNGHTISGDDDFSESEEAGVQIRGFDGAVVENGTIANFPQVVNAGDFGPVTDAVIRNISGDGIFGLVFLVGDRNRLERNSFTGGGDGGLFVVGDDNVIFRNAIRGDWDIPVRVRGDRNRITHNLIRAEEHCQILVDVSGAGNEVRHNDASGGGFCGDPPV
jgi:parallel beta helix pectate lyase-like protein